MQGRGREDGRIGGREEGKNRGRQGTYSLFRNCLRRRRRGIHRPFIALIQSRRPPGEGRTDGRKEGREGGYPGERGGIKEGGKEGRSFRGRTDEQREGRGDITRKERSTSRKEGRISPPHHLFRIASVVLFVHLLELVGCEQHIIVVH
jgi:hypothetical protein